MAEEISVLKKLDFFSYFNEEELKAAAKIMSEVDYPAEKVVFDEGDEGQTLYIIKSGEVRISKKDPEGREQVLALLKDGDIFGEMSFLDGRPHSATVTTVHNSRILKIEKVDFDKFIEAQPKAAYKIMKNIVFAVDTIVRKMNSQYVDMMSYMFGRRRF